MPAASPAGSAGVLVLLTLAVVGAQAVGFKQDPSTCSSITQCFLMGLDPPRSQGEWTTAYLLALHEHCAGLLQQGGVNECYTSTRCVLLKPDGRLVTTGNSSSSGHKAGVVGLSDASFLHAYSNGSAASSSPGGSSSSTTAAYWKSTAAALKLRQPACVPIPEQVDSLRTRACTWQKPPGGSDAVQMAKVCEGHKHSCLIGNISDAEQVAAWWQGSVPQQALEESSSWASEDRRYSVARRCVESWNVQDKRVTDACATRGYGTNPVNQSLTLNRLVVAVMDAYESSGCNNTVTYSEAMAVQRIVTDLCMDVGCKVSSAATTNVARACWHLLAPLLMLLWLAGLLQ